MAKKSNLKSYFYIVCGLFYLLLLNNASADVNMSGKPQELVFLTWVNYINMEIVKEFEKKYNAKIKFVYFESDDIRDNMMTEADGNGYDIVLVSGTQLTAYKRNGWLAPVKAKNIPNLKHIAKRWLGAYPEALGYGVPYFWGTVGIAYREDLVSKPITSWKQFFNPSEELSGKILLVESSRDVVGMALKSLDYSVNSVNIEELKQAEALLLKQKPHVQKYRYIATSSDSTLVTGESVAALVFNGDALLIGEFNPKIKFVLPDEGSNLWVDYLTVNALSKNKELAYAFINFMNIPEIAAKQAEEIYYATPNMAAEKLLPKEFLNDPVIYPNKAQVAKSEFYRELPPRILKTINRIMADLLR